MLESWEDLLERVSLLHKHHSIVTQSGTWDFSEYNWGYANGIIKALSILLEKDMQLLPKPREWGSVRDTLDYGISKKP